MKLKNRYLYYSILPCLLFLIAIGVYVSGYNPPTQGPPFGNLPAPINAGPDAQTKTGNLTIEGNLTTKGILKLGQFATADLPAGAEGALCFDTTKNAMQIYTSNAWRDLMVVKLGLGETCSLNGDCDLGHCVDGYCCNASCEGTCNRCNVAGSIGTCIEAPSDCTGGCSICSSGNCIADPTKCTGNCVQCTGSGTAYSCSANDASCTGDCSFCTGADTEYNCAGSNGFCLNDTSSCNCSGSDVEFNCQSCPDTYGVCGHPTCSSNSCSNAYDNGVYCAYNGHDNGASNYYCSSGSCLCTSSAGTSSPDGKDNDCDGTVDERDCLDGSSQGYTWVDCECDTCSFSLDAASCRLNVCSLCWDYCASQGCGDFTGKCNPLYPCCTGGGLLEYY